MFKDPENMLKGDMAQSLVENLLRAVGNQVYRFGYESILQNLTQVDRVFDRYSDEGEQISSIPDFLVVNKKGRPILIEVKFRWNGMWQKDDIQSSEITWFGDNSYGHELASGLYICLFSNDVGDKHILKLVILR